MDGTFPIPCHLHYLGNFGADRMGEFLERRKLEEARVNPARSDYTEKKNKAQTEIEPVTPTHQK